MEFLSAFGTYAYCLPDITCCEWGKFDSSLSRDAWELYHANERLTMEAAYAKSVVYWRGRQELESFFQQKKYRVLGTLKDGFRVRRLKDWDDGYWDDDGCWVASSQETEWVNECDIVIRGYIKYDPQKTERDVVIPGALWDKLRELVGSDELPIDSELEFKTGDFIGGEWYVDCYDRRDVTSGELRVDEFVRVKFGSLNAARQVIMPRSVIAERNRKLNARKQVPLMI